MQALLNNKTNGVQPPPRSRAPPPASAPHSPRTFSPPSSRGGDDTCRGGAGAARSRGGVAGVSEGGWFAICSPFWPFSYTAEKADEGARWAYLSPPRVPAVRVASRYSIVFFGVFHSGIRNSAIHVVIGHHARAHTHPYLNSQEGPSTHPDDLLQRCCPFPYRTSFIAPLRTHRHEVHAATSAPATTAVWGHHAVVPPPSPRTTTADMAQAQAEADRSMQNKQGQLRVIAHWLILIL
ncbi:hypothetical protein B0H14DRAFT_2633716 [Mycena olivaceomarginata]|nr:hypothetical protein B0H14DRAFT_2633716 [Mycena olivaceomarginata]